MVIYPLESAQIRLEDKEEIIFYCQQPDTFWKACMVISYPDQSFLAVFDGKESLLTDLHQTLEKGSWQVSGMETTLWFDFEDAYPRFSWLRHWISDLAEETKQTGKLKPEDAQQAVAALVECSETTRFMVSPSHEASLFSALQKLLRAYSLPDETAVVLKLVRDSCILDIFAR